MTTYDAAFESALSSNVTKTIGLAIECAGQSFTDFINDLPEEVYTEEKQKLAEHILHHLKAINSLAMTSFLYTEDKLNKFEEDEPGKLEAVAEELKDSDIINELQTVLNATSEELDNAVDKRNADLAVKQMEKLMKEAGLS